MNWIEEVVKELNNYMASEVMVGDSPQKRKAIIRGSLVSHAPVIDAEKLADRIVAMSRQSIHHHNSLLFKTNVSALITDSIDLKITWVDGKAEWGSFELYVGDSKTAFHKKYWHLYLHTSQIQCTIRFGHIRGRRNAQQACEKALEGIITGVKK